jgi:site-specific DNA-methyltransferase (adenine-specific)
MKVTDKITITNEDNMALMARYPDNYFDLAIVDPPYGLGKRLSQRGGKHKNTKFAVLYENSSQWDNEIPNENYFKEVFRVSKNQIIWGANYYLEFLPSTRGIICWDKKQYMPTFSRIEFAWTSFDAVARLFEGTSTDLDRFHPTQKPVALYKWLLDKYAKPNDKILDTHLGSMSIAIACADYGFELVGCELDKEYYEAGIKRVQNHTAQTKLF